MRQAINIMSSCPMLHLSGVDVGHSDRGGGWEGRSDSDFGDSEVSDFRKHPLIGL
ncbi:hypothetical protein [Streptococcus sp.]|uniref:hypothetical protein n=1 Tax=Streptococcus sp. TaxID=1306 RepID=UPI003919B790